MTLIRFIFTFSLATLLLLFSPSLPTSAAADGEGKGVLLIPLRRAKLLGHTVMKAGEKVEGDAINVDDPTCDLPKKLRIHMRKGRGGRVTGVAPRARSRGRTCSSAVGTRLSSFHFAAVLGCSLLLGFILL